MKSDIEFMTFSFENYNILRVEWNRFPKHSFKYENSVDYY